MCAFSPATIPAGAFNGGTVTGKVGINTTDNPQFLVEDGAAHTLFSVDPNSSYMQVVAGSKLTVGAQTLTFEANNGDDLLLVTPTLLDLDPSNGQVFVKHGALILANTSAPADADFFNGAFSLWLDTGVGALKVKAKIGGSFVTASIPLV